MSFLQCHSENSIPAPIELINVSDRTEEAAGRLFSPGGIGRRHRGWYYRRSQPLLFRYSEVLAVQAYALALDRVELGEVLYGAHPAANGGKCAQGLDNHTREIFGRRTVVSIRESRTGFAS